jgi:acetoin utilization deacetylase AcuC-like enzyme
MSPLENTVLQTFPIAWHQSYLQPLPFGHRFPMEKYDLIPGQLLHEGTITSQDIFAPDECPDEIVQLTHTKDYIAALHNLTLTAREQRVIGFPQDAALMQREFRIAQGTIDCILKAEHTGIAMNIAGGTHHAFAGHGEGFCMLNDQAIAANYLLHKKKATQILIIDLDVHQGNGTAKIFENSPAVYTFSMHGAGNYPFRKETSDRDVGLPVGITDDDYNELLEKNLAEIFGFIEPDHCFYLAGVDVLSTDKFGKLGLTLTGCMQRDRIVLEKMRSKNIPCAVSMGGGYSPDVRTIVEAHCNTFRVAKDVYGL